MTTAHPRAEGFPVDAPPPKTSNELAQQRTDMATGRTLMAADRSLMAWVRTALSMISFGFTIYKILEGLPQSGVALRDQDVPRAVGLFLTGLGTASMIIGSVEYRHRINMLRAQYPIPLWRPTFIIAMIMSVTGLFIFVSIVARVL